MSLFGLKCLRKGSIYDTTMGASVDANGFTTFPLRPTTAVRYFVGFGGSDSNTGLSHAQRFATLAKAVSLMVAGNGDQVLIAEGTTLNETLPQGGDPHSWLGAFGGFSALYPTLFSSYDPADPTNEAKIGMGHQRSARPVFTKAYTAALGNGTYGNIAVKGLSWSTGTGAGQAMTLNGTISNIIFENCVCPFNGFSFDDGTDGITQAPTSSRVIIRNCSNTCAFSTSGAHAQNIYANGIVGFTYEDNVNYHAGWSPSVSRDAIATLGGPTIFNHPIYIQASCYNIIVRRNLIMDGSADCGIIRGNNATIYENVSIHCPDGTGLGPGNAQEFAAFPSGVLQQVYHNLHVAGIDMNSTNPRGNAYSAQNIAPGSRLHHNLAIHNTATPATNDQFVRSTGSVYYLGPGATQPCALQVDHNVMYQWSAAGYAYSESNTPITNTYDFNIWDNVASGTNTNSGSATFPNPYTEAGLYTAAGTALGGAFTDYASLVTYSTANPDAHVQRTIRSLAFAGYGVTG